MSFFMPKEPAWKITRGNNGGYEMLVEVQGVNVQHIVSRLEEVLESIKIELGVKSLPTAGEVILRSMEDRNN